MVIKFKKADPEDVFKNTMKGKLGEAIVKQCLGDLVSEIDCEVLPNSGDGKIDLTVNSDREIGIQVKTRYSSAGGAEWRVSLDELDANQAIACVLIYSADAGAQDFDEFQSEYCPIMAGFMPTDLILEDFERGESDRGKVRDEKASFPITIEDLSYEDGLRN
ncbi:MAG: hypothetical protein MUC60_06670 [Oscillatoria sp. Prado101]|jgi:hypothetical protein|nr:hypothetical protein [Oscillatoria sp. Prado101]